MAKVATERPAQLCRRTSSFRKTCWLDFVVLFYVLGCLLVPGRVDHCLTRAAQTVSSISLPDHCRYAWRPGRRSMVRDAERCGIDACSDLIGLYKGLARSRLVVHHFYRVDVEACLRSNRRQVLAGLSRPRIARNLDDQSEPYGCARPQKAGTVI